MENVDQQIRQIDSDIEALARVAANLQERRGQLLRLKGDNLTPIKPFGTLIGNIFAPRRPNTGPEIA